MSVTDYYCIICFCYFSYCITCFCYCSCCIICFCYCSYCLTFFCYCCYWIICFCHFSYCLTCFFTALIELSGSLTALIALPVSVTALVALSGSVTALIALPSCVTALIELPSFVTALILLSGFDAANIELSPPGVLFSFYGATAPSGPGPPPYRSFTITHKHTTFSRTPLDEWSARRRELYLTTHNTHKRQTCMSPAGFNPAVLASERSQTHDLDHLASGIGLCCVFKYHIYCLIAVDCSARPFWILLFLLPQDARLRRYSCWSCILQHNYSTALIINYNVQQWHYCLTTWKRANLYTIKILCSKVRQSCSTNIPLHSIRLSFWLAIKVNRSPTNDAVICWIPTSWPITFSSWSIEKYKIRCPA